MHMDMCMHMHMYIDMHMYTHIDMSMYLRTDPRRLACFAQALYPPRSHFEPLTTPTDSGGLAYPKIKRWGSLSRAGGFLQARGRCAWTRLTPIEMRMETTTVLAHFNRHEERLRWRLCSPQKTSSSWSGFEERSMTEVRVGS